MIPRNSSLPASKLMGFRTHADNQANVKIEVVEGGDDRGVNATKIGKCIVEDLPTDTPKGTRVEVQFDYSQDGRLEVSASLPSVERQVQMSLNRAAGLSDEDIESWIQRIENGLADPQSPPIDVVATAGHDGPDELLPADDEEEIPFAVITDDETPPPKPVIKVTAKKPEVSSPKVVAKPVASNGPKKVAAKPVKNSFANQVLLILMHRLRASKSLLSKRWSSQSPSSVHQALLPHPRKSPLRNRLQQTSPPHRRRCPKRQQANHQPVCPRLLPRSMSVKTRSARPCPFRPPIRVCPRYSS